MADQLCAVDKRRERLQRFARKGGSIDLRLRKARLPCERAWKRDGRVHKRMKVSFFSIRSPAYCGNFKHAVLMHSASAGHPNRAKISFHWNQCAIGQEIALHA